MITAAQALTLWTIRASAVLYFVALAGWLTRRDRLSRILWTIACALYLAHVAAAFHFYHGWSHAAAYRETARQTFDVFGVRWGGGLYFNYAFTVIWIADALWWWRNADGDGRRRRGITIAIHTFFAFMFFNATVVFATGWTRWLGVAGTVALALLWRRAKRLDILSQSG